MIRFEAVIDKKGAIVTTVTERTGTECNTVLNFTNRLGQQVSDEITGPNCDPNFNTEGNLTSG